jgi:hypothetical protein
MQGIQRRHEVHIGSTHRGHQILGQPTSSKARASAILWLRLWAQPARPGILCRLPGQACPHSHDISGSCPYMPTLSSRRVPASKDARDASRRSWRSSWAGGLVSEPVQELHRRLSDTSVRLHGEGNEGGEAVRLHSRRCDLLLVVPPAS